MKTNEKKIYENAEMEIVAVDNNDIICNSPGGVTPPSTPTGPGGGSNAGFDPIPGNPDDAFFG